MLQNAVPTPHSKKDKNRDLSGRKRETFFFNLIKLGRLK